MTTSAERHATRERVRKHRAVMRGETYTPSIRTCTSCGCRMSRYADPRDTYCAPCFAKHGTHEDYTSSHDPADQRIRLAGPETCRNGHDLRETGQLVNAGGGRMSRRCMTCRREREAQHHRDKRARDRANRTTA